jgi:hypothetical protein
MTRTQIQLPDELFKRAKQVCEAREISMAELARRGLEYMLSVYAPERGNAGQWSPPAPRPLGWKGLGDREIKEQAQRTAAEISLLGGSGQ